MLFGSLFLPKNPSFFCPLLCFKSGLLPTFSGLFTFLTGKNKGCKGIYLRFCPKKSGQKPTFKTPKWARTTSNYAYRRSIEGLTTFIAHFAHFFYPYYMIEKFKYYI